jgi:hypothetical protein
MKPNKYNTFLSIVGMFCTALIVSGNCGQLVVPEPIPLPAWNLKSWDFEWMHNNTSEKMCGHVSSDVIGAPVAMWLELNVTGDHVPLEIYANVNYTAKNGIVTPMHLTSPSLDYYPGNYSVHITGEDQFLPGTYDVIEVIAKKV